MTPQNQRRLLPFDDPAKARALMSLPLTLLADLASGRSRSGAKRRGPGDKPPTMTKVLADLARQPPTREAALIVQSALAVEILLMQPIRLKNLTSLDLDRQIIRSGKRTHLAITLDEVKNEVAIEAVLPAPTAELLEAYVARYRPLLIRTPSPWLFPGRRDGQPKCRRRLREQITETVKHRCGEIANPHLFRHIAAKLYLKAHPGAYGVVRLLLGHKSVNTSTKYYCGTETVAALQHFDAFVLSLRETSSDDREDNR